MEKEFVAYELAVKLKALGFDEPCLAWYPVHEILLFMGMKLGSTTPDFVTQNSPWIQSEKIKTCIAPTFSQAFRWFRENHRLSVLIHDCLDDYIGEIVEWTLTENKIIHQVPNRIETYEEAELACLKKLIEIVESKEK